jgi:hypothetical protein
VTDQVVHGVEGLLERHRERLRRSHADHQRPRETGAARDRDRVQVLQPDPRLGDRLLDRRLQRVEMGARRDLRHDAAVARVLVHARRDRVAEQGATAHDADTGLVAARLDAQHEGLGHAILLRSHFMITASTSSGW